MNPMNNEPARARVGRAYAERRLGVVKLPANSLLDMLTVPMGRVVPPFTYLSVSDVPAGADVVATEYDPASRTFDLLVCHPSLDPVEDGMRPPVVNSTRVVVQIPGPTGLQHHVAAWQFATFPEATDASVRAHLHEERGELYEAMGAYKQAAFTGAEAEVAATLDRVMREAADCLLLLFAAAARAGVDLLGAAARQLASVVGRDDYPVPAMAPTANGPTERLRQIADAALGAVPDARQAAPDVVEARLGEAAAALLYLGDQLGEDVQAAAAAKLRENAGRTWAMTDRGYAKHVEATGHARDVGPMPTPKPNGKAPHAPTSNRSASNGAHPKTD